MPRDPLIGVTPGYAGPSEQREFCKTAEVVYCDLNYIRCLELANGIPLLLPHVGDRGLDELANRMDGLLLTGGEDVHPGRYDQAVLYHNGAIAEARDDFEIGLLKAFFRTGKPVLAVCRGIQVLNVAMGGTLYQDLPSQINQFHHSQRAATTTATHRIRLDERSRIAQAVGTACLEVNSHHHQAVDRVADELTAMGWSEEGVVEAVEHKGEPYIVGVQWHPERLAAAQSTQHRIFADFVQACRSGL
jgi:putative glutamine amidotransferase